MTLRVVVYGLLCLLSSRAADAQKIFSSHAFRYQFTAPPTLKNLQDSSINTEANSAWYDDSLGIYLMITARQGHFTNIKSYLDCSRADLEKDLRFAHDDSTLHLIDCRISGYYPDKSIVLHFSTQRQGGDLDRCMIYFFHHRGSEIQFSFIYSGSRIAPSLAYIDQVMQTLVLTE
jgi:hypothetical protein